MGQNHSNLSVRNPTSQKSTLTGNDNMIAQGDINLTQYLGSSTNAVSSTNGNSFMLISHPTTHFVGREVLLEETHRLLTSCATKESLWDRIVVIQGFGGMGKSELARRYVEIYKNNEIIQNVAWINSETKSSLESSFKRIANKFQLKTEGVGVEDLAQGVFDHFSENFESGLFIFDNVEQCQNKAPHFEIANYLPNQQAKLPLILITSRVKNWEGPKTRNNILDITELIVEDSMKLLTTALTLDDEQKNDTQIQAAVRDLALELQGYPLGLILAAANICCDGGANVEDEIRKYIKLLEEINSGWMKHEHSPGSMSTYTLVMDNVWRATTEKIKGMGDDGECALTLLNILAYLPTDDISKSHVDEIVHFGYSAMKDHLVRGYSILERYSLISVKKAFQRYNLTIDIHRHVQRCTRESLNSIPDHSYLLTIGQFNSSNNLNYIDKLLIDIHIHRQLKKTMWPDGSIRKSIDVLHNSLLYLNSNGGTEVALDLAEAKEIEGGAFFHLLDNEYMTLMEMSLYIISELEDQRIKISDKHRSHWNEQYEKGFNTALQIFTNYARSSTFGSYRAVMDKIESYFSAISKGEYKFRNERILDKMRDSFIKKIDDPATDPDSRFYFLKINYGCLNQPYLYQEGKNTALNLKTALQLHSKYYTNDCSWQKNEYWSNGGPIESYTLLDHLRELKKKRINSSLPTDLEKSIVEVFVGHGGLQLVQQHFDHVVADSSITNIYLLDLVMLLMTEYNCSEDFKKAPQFLHSLKQLTELIISQLKSTTNLELDVQWLLLWFGLFPSNCAVEDTEGRKWSLASVEKDIKQLSCFLDDENHWINLLIEYRDTLIIRALGPHLKLSESNPRQGWVFKVAVELMDKDIRGRQRNGLCCKEWRAEFEEKFNNQKSTPQEIFAIGRKYGFTAEAKSIKCRIA